jgi:hypothetical protein
MSFDELLHQVEFLVLFKVSQKPGNLVVVAQLFQGFGFAGEQTVSGLQEAGFATSGLEVFNNAGGVARASRVFSYVGLTESTGTQSLDNLVTPV